LEIPAGPLVVVRVWGTGGLTPWTYDGDWVSPCPSETVTPIVQFCWLPVVFCGAVQIGVWSVALLKLPIDGSVGQEAVQA
jgi:hypothetical protein